MRRVTISAFFVLACSISYADESPKVDCTKVPAFKKIACLQHRIDQLEDDLSKKIEKVDNGSIKNGQSVYIQSHVYTDKCLDQRSNPNPHASPDEVRMVTCVFTDPAGSWTLSK